MWSTFPTRAEERRRAAWSPPYEGGQQQRMLHFFTSFLMFLKLDVYSPSLCMVVVPFWLFFLKPSDQNSGTGF